MGVFKTASIEADTNRCPHVGEVKSRNVRIGARWHRICWDCLGRAAKHGCDVPEEAFEADFWQDWPGD